MLKAKFEKIIIKKQEKKNYIGHPRLICYTHNQNHEIRLTL